MDGSSTWVAVLRNPQMRGCGSLRATKPPSRMSPCMAWHVACVFGAVRLVLSDSVCAHADCLGTTAEFIQWKEGDPMPDPCAPGQLLTPR